MSTYFTIPYSQLPTTPGYTVWYATWSTVRPADAESNPPLVACYTTGTPPQNAQVLASSVKDPTPPPPPPLPVIDTSEYQTTMQAWIATQNSRGL